MARFTSAVVVALMAITLLQPASAPVAAAEEPIVAAALSPAPSHPYTDPSWYPLRSSDLDSVLFWDGKALGGPWSALMGCAQSGNGCGPDNHGYWALDFNGDEGDPVYAAGAGVFHVEESNAACVGDNQRSTRGNWGWIDHGGGMTSRYHHLDTIRAGLDGTLVTPDTRIGTLGKSGSRCTSGVYYLHFSVSNQGAPVNGTADHVNPGSLTACRTGTTYSYPQALKTGARSWNDIIYRKDGIPAGDNSCVANTTRGDRALATPNRVGITGRPGNGSATILWGPPSTPATGVALFAEIWRPSTRKWDANGYRRLAPTARSTKYTGLTNGRSYRYRVAYRNKHGYARWSETRVVIPATPPSVPDFRSLEASSNRVRLAWGKSRENGRPVTSYTAAIRQRIGDSWGRWQTVRVHRDTRSYAWEGLRTRRTFGARVRANSAVGPSAWTRVRTVTTG